MESQDRIVPPGKGRAQRFMPGELFTWKTTGGTMDFGELSLAPSVGPPEHIHHGHDEAYYILEGTYRFKVGGELAEASEGTFVFIPRGTPHAWANVGEKTGRVTVIFTPGGMASYFEELEPLLPELMAGLGDLTKVDPAVLAKAEAIMQRYEYELVGPPLN